MTVAIDSDSQNDEARALLLMFWLDNESVMRPKVKLVGHLWGQIALRYVEQ